MEAGLAIYIFVFLFQGIWCQDPLVMTTNGLVRGSRAIDGDYSVFFGIPYAQVDRENPFGFYLGHEIATQDVLDNMAKFDSDFTYNYGTDRSILYHLSNSNYPIYQYVFGYVGSLSMGPGATGSNSSATAVGHGGDLAYLFKQSGVDPTIEDQLIIDRFSTMWTNFAKFSDPTPELSDLLPVRWPTVSLETRDYLWIDRELSVGQKLFHDRIAFWDLFFVAYGNYFWLY